METRTVIVEFTHAALSKAKEGVYFPSVRAWLQNGGAIRCDATNEFPGWGAVFLGSSLCGDAMPTENQFAYVDCIPSQYPAAKAKWSVSDIKRSLCEVIKVPPSVNSFLGFYEWIRTGLSSSWNGVFGGTGSLYLELSFCGVLVGPFVLREQGRIPCPNGLSYWTRQTVPVWEIEPNGPFFVDGNRLDFGKPFPSDAIALLRKVSGLLNTELGPLSKAKSRSFAEAIIGLQDTPLIPHAVKEVADLFDTVGDVLIQDNAFLSALIGNKAICDALESRWLEVRSDKLAQAASLNTELSALESNRTKLTAEVRSLESAVEQKSAEVTQVMQEVTQAKQAAKNAFEKELGILANDPAKVAVIGSLFSQLGSSSFSRKSNSTERQELTASKWSLFESKLALIGISGVSRKDLALVCRASFISSQPIWIRSTFSELIANVIFSCRGHSEILTVDVPAGLLEPLILPLESTTKAWLFHHANRSDLSLVWGSIRDRLFHQILCPTDNPLEVVLTLEPNSYLSVTQDLPFGPIIDDSYLSFVLPKEAPETSLSEEHKMSQPDGVEFDEVVGDSMLKLGPLRVSSFRMGCVLAFSSLKSLVNDDLSETKRLFFKYWLLPRISISAAHEVLKENAKEFSSDPVLKALAEMDDKNGND